MPFVLEAGVLPQAADALRELRRQGFPYLANAWRNQLHAFQIVREPSLLPLCDDERDVVTTLLGRPPKSGGEEVSAE
jgi:hypothetical protein